jgi:hypothetical protein
VAVKAEPITIDRASITVTRFIIEFATPDAQASRSVGATEVYPASSGGDAGPEAQELYAMWFLSVHILFMIECA